MAETDDQEDGAPRSRVDTDTQTPREAYAKRTLMKSPPELWELADDDRRLGVWMSMLLAERDPLPVEVTEREENARLAWRATSHDGARIELAFSDGGFGTVVEARAVHPGVSDNATLESIIDDLGSVERRPFSAA